jgi:hypothetical protein
MEMSLSSINQVSTHNMQLKPLISFARSKHLRSEATPSKCESHFDPPATAPLNWVLGVMELIP